MDTPSRGQLKMSRRAEGHQNRACNSCRTRKVRHAESLSPKHLLNQLVIFCRSNVIGPFQRVSYAEFKIDSVYTRVSLPSQGKPSSSTPPG